MGSKWGKVGLTKDGVLYVSEQPDPEDVKRVEEEIAKGKSNEAEIERRYRALGQKASWS